MALTIEYFNARVRKDEVTGCWLWTGGKNPKGYGSMANGKGGHYPAHRFSYETFVAPVANWKGLDCCHTCDTPACVNPEHLFVGTRSDNMKDAGKKGRHWSQKAEHREKVVAATRKAGKEFGAKRSGERGPLAKLTDAQAEEIRARFAAGETKTALGIAYGVSRKAIFLIVTGKTFRRSQ